MSDNARFRTYRRAGFPTQCHRARPARFSARRPECPPSFAHRATTPARPRRANPAKPCPHRARRACLCHQRAPSISGCCPRGNWWNRAWTRQPRHSGRRGSMSACPAAAGWVAGGSSPRSPHRPPVAPRRPSGHRYREKRSAAHRATMPRPKAGWGCWLPVGPCHWPDRAPRSGATRRPCPRYKPSSYHRATMRHRPPAPRRGSIAAACRPRRRRHRDRPARQRRCSCHRAKARDAECPARGAGQCW